MYRRMTDPVNFSFGDKNIFEGKNIVKILDLKIWGAPWA